jgi:hypothetical protein
MADCVNCKCADIVVGKTACKSLKAQNDDVIKQHALVLRDSQLCNIVEEVSKFAYSQWCFNKNVNEQLCWIAQNMNDGSALKEIEKVKAENAKLKSALTNIIENLKESGAWEGDLDGYIVQGRNIATGNINIFGGTPDGNSFIRTNSRQTENDLAGG